MSWVVNQEPPQECRASLRFVACAKNPPCDVGSVSSEMLGLTLVGKVVLLFVGNDPGGHSAVSMSTEGDFHTDY